MGPFDCDVQRPEQRPESDRVQILLTVIEWVYSIFGYWVCVSKMSRTQTDPSLCHVNCWWCCLWKWSEEHGLKKFPKSPFLCRCTERVKWKVQGVNTNWHISVLVLLVFVFALCSDLFGLGLIIFRSSLGRLSWKSVDSHWVQVVFRCTSPKFCTCEDFI